MVNEHAVARKGLASRFGVFIFVHDQFGDGLVVFHVVGYGAVRRVFARSGLVAPSSAKLETFFEDRTVLGDLGGLPKKLRMALIFSAQASRGRRI